jgi:hypothetical protein
VSGLIRKLAREPLLHFVLLGAAIFAASSLLARDQRSDPQEIVVTRARIENLVATFERTWQRPPTQAELDDLIREHVREEVAYREALTLELDRDDSIVRRRLRQKLEFISEDLSAQAEPSDDELKAYWRANPGLFTRDARVTFQHVYLNPERHDDMAGDAARILAELEQSTDAGRFATLGDRFLLGGQFEDISIVETRSTFGDGFGSRVAALPLREWQGPIDSGYGTHLVFVADRSESQVPAFEEVRDLVRREWSNARRLNAKEELYRALLEHYTVVIEADSGDGTRVVGGVR